MKGSAVAPDKGTHLSRPSSIGSSDHSSVTGSTTVAMDKAIRNILNNKDSSKGLMRMCAGNPITRSGKRAQMTKMLTLTLVPILALGVMSILQLMDVSLVNRRARVVRGIIRNSVQAGNLVHFLQRERDMTALHVSSRNKGSESRMLLTTTYPLTDDALEKLSQWPGEKDDSKTQFASSVNFQKHLNKHRRDIEPGKTTVRDQIMFYSESINQIIDWLYTAIQKSLEGGDWLNLVAYQLLIISKEDLGVERTLGGIFFVTGGFESYHDYLWYANKYYVGEGNFEAAKLFTPVIEKMFIEALDKQAQNLSKNVENMRRMIREYNLGRSVTLNEPSWEMSTFWFDNMTIYLDILFDVQLRMAETILQSLDDSLSDDTGNISASISLLCLIVVVCPLIVMSVKAIVADTQRYALTLADQSKNLDKERKRTDALLFQMLPRPIAEQLKCGKYVKPENYNDVTIFFSDIVGFTRISSSCAPVQVVDMLNNLYMCFDIRIDVYDVYKIETIGDAYMVASGVPKRNGKKHASEIATLSLDLQYHIGRLEIPHLPETKMRLRVGIHTGPVVAAVVGSKMPRYCLFGDTVNTASRMESAGKADAIHISPQTNSVLQQIGGFETVSRGKVDIKGKGGVETFWLIGKQGFEEVLRDLPTIASPVFVDGDDPRTDLHSSLTSSSSHTDALPTYSQANEHEVRMVAEWRADAGASQPKEGVSEHETWGVSSSSLSPSWNEALNTKFEYTWHSDSANVSTVDLRTINDATSLLTPRAPTKATSTQRYVQETTLSLT